MMEKFDRFGGFISIDVMKGVLNTNSYPYIAVIKSYTSFCIRLFTTKKIRSNIFRCC